MARLFVLLLAFVGFGAQPAPAAGFQKAIWGPVTRGGESQFPVYKSLGVDIYETGLEWDHVAPTRPAKASDPNDPAYHWPSAVDDAVARAKKAGIRVSITLTRAPSWASGHPGGVWIPRKPSDFAAFARAAARHYRSVHLWMIWGEPTRLGNLKPLSKKGPVEYAKLLDGAYGALKGVSRKNT